MKKTLAALVVAVAMLSLTGSALAATAGQRNAVSSAQDYLDYQAFSKSGLIKQLKFEHFSGSDARYAVNHIQRQLERAGGQVGQGLPRLPVVLALGPDRPA